MNERGFVTVFALCLILAIALIVKGIQESDTNHNYEAANLQTEFDLQNAADGGIYEAAEKVRVATENGEELLPASRIEAERQKNQIHLVSHTTESLYGQIRVDVWGERLHVQKYKRDYPSYAKNTDGKPLYGFVLFSVAEIDSKNLGKKYRRAFAYVIDGYGYDSDKNQVVQKSVDPSLENKIHFMELPSTKNT